MIVRLKKAVDNFRSAVSGGSPVDSILCFIGELTLFKNNYNFHKQFQYYDNVIQIFIIKNTAQY